MTNLLPSPHFPHSAQPLIQPTVSTSQIMLLSHHGGKVEAMLDGDIILESGLTEPLNHNVEVADEPDGADEHCGGELFLIMMMLR